MTGRGPDLGDLVGRHFGEAGCWFLVREALDRLGTPAWEPLDALRVWRPGAPIELNEPDWWRPVPVEEAEPVSVVLLRDRGGVPCHMGIVADPGWLVHHTDELGGVRTQLRRYVQAGLVERAWRVTA